MLSPLAKLERKHELRDLNIRKARLIRIFELRERVNVENQTKIEAWIDASK
jgi:hypothetical protein